MDPGQDLEHAFEAIIAGRDVKRSCHDLVVDGRDHSAAFVAALARAGFVPTRVGDVEVALDRRIPAFVVRDGQAWFGWVFWEKFTEAKRRKLFGSVVKDARGDWVVELGAGDPTVLHAQPALAVACDPEHPSSW